VDSNEEATAVALIVDPAVWREVIAEALGLIAGRFARVEPRRRRRQLHRLIDDITSTAARQHGFVFAEVRSIFVGTSCAVAAKWLHALNFAELSISYHPMATGQSSGYYPVSVRQPLADGRGGR
jgi:hypothetical protein